MKWKKIAAVGAGVLMGITTLAGALAADLKDYPAPFIADGKFNAILVIGARAQPIDNVGVTNIATSLQYVAATPISGVTEVSISEGVKLEKTGNAFNYYDSMRDIQDTPLDDTDMPEILADGSFEDDEGDEETYTQTLLLDPEAGNTGLLTFDQPEDMDADAYFELLDSENVYEYELEFDDDVDYDDTDDLESSTIEIQGNTYTITAIDLNATGHVTDLTLMAGETTRWLTQGEPFTVMQNGQSYTVTVIDVDEDATKCGIDVDGEMKWIDVDKTKDFGELTIGVTDAVAVHEAAQDKDICEVNIGAMEVIMKNSDELEVNNVDLDGSNVDMVPGSTNYSWAGFRVQYEPDDDVYLADGEAWTDPVMGNFKILYAGITGDYEDIEVRTSGSTDVELEFMNNDRQEVSIPWFVDEDGTLTGPGNNTVLGEDYDELLLLEGSTYTDPDNDSVEGTMFLYVTAGGEAHVIEITGVDEDELKADFKDTTYGTTYSNKDFVLCTMSSIGLGSLGSVNLNLCNTTDDDIDQVTTGEIMNYTDRAFGMETENNGIIIVADDWQDPAGIVQEMHMEENIDGTQPIMEITVNLVWDTGDDEIQVKSVDDTTAILAGLFVDAEEGESDIQKAATFVGTLITWDQEDGDYVTLMHPEGDAEGNVFVAPIGGEAVVSGVAGAVVINKIDVGATKLDTEVADIKAQNAIVVGGPCVNTGAADLMGNPADCTAGFEMGKAIVKLFTNDGNVAMLVAGYSGEDTRAASRVVANYQDYPDFEGMEVEVTTATETITSVG